MYKILIMDDDLSMHRILKRLIPNKYVSELKCVDTANEGIEYANTYKPDIVFVDFILPDLNGILTCMRIKSIRNYSPKVLLISSYTKQEINEEIQESKIVGADGFITKDKLLYNIEPLMALLHSSISIKKEEYPKNRDFIKGIEEGIEHEVI